jgi:hypothetical protein
MSKFGYYIAEFEQKGADRAQYGPDCWAGTSNTQLKLYRSFYCLYPIGPTVSDQLESITTRLEGAPQK